VTTTSPPPRRSTGIQALRFVAALLVVAAHVPPYVRERTASAPPSLPTQLLGELGVSVFFAISGFVAVVTTRRTPRTGARRFASRRLLRIVPLAWALLTCKILVGVVVPGLLERFRPDTWYVIASYAFLPARGPDGQVQPLYTVMWTLSFELFFYAVVTVALVARRDPLTVVAPVMTALACASVFRPEHWPAWQFHADPYVLLFVVGMVLAHVAHGTATPRTIAWGVVAVTVWTTAMLVAPTPAHSTVLLLPIATVALALTLSVESRIPERLVPGLNMLGDASYALYLVHPLTTPAVIAVAALVLPPSTPWEVFGLIGVAAAVLSGLTVWSAVDRPLMRHLGLGPPGSRRGRPTARHRSRGPGGVGGQSPFARATPPYQCADGFGVRSNVSRSQATSPNVGRNPDAHS
jgi:exopolysaccharide production protein ExoZ